MTLLDVTEATKRFGDTVAVDDVSLRVARGEVVGLLGANGAGKTTLIRMILGLLPVDAGQVHVLGGAPSRGVRARMGYVPQGLGLWTDLTVQAHLELAAAVYGRPLHEPADADVTAAGGTLVRDLPLGLRRRVAFTLALAHAPDVLLLDEPTSGVDPLARARLWDVIRAAADEGAGVLVSTHYFDEAELCDRAVLLADGRVVAAGQVADLTAGSRAVLV
ncbi:MAG: ABC transporter ATP-binding protein, partial [Egibacteraceae bacterium]